MPAPGDRALAIPNYIVYMLVVIVGILGAEKYVSASRERRLILLSIFAWTAVSELYWFIAATNLNGGLTAPIFLEATVTIVVSMLILTAVARRGINKASNHR